MRARTAQADPGPGDADHDPASRTAPLACARCGYDVSGPVDAWTDSCPVEGTCPECGLRFRWQDVFDPLRDVPAWFFELAPAKRIWTFPVTWIRTLAPWRFWRAVKLSFPLRPRRLMLFAALVGVGIWLLVALELLLYEGLVERGFWSQGWVQQGGRWVRTVPQFSSANTKMLARATLRWPFGGHGFWGWPESSWLFVVFLAAVPAGFGVLGESLGRAKVLVAHVMRAAVYSAASAGALFCVAAAIPGAAEAVLGAVCRATRRPAYTFPRLDALCSWSMENQWLLAASLMFPWTLLCWWIVCRRYFRIEHAVWVALAMTLIGALLVTVIALLFTHAFTELLVAFV